MKKLIIFVLFFSLFLTGCSKRNNGEEFIGTWKSLEEGHQYIFYRDGDNISVVQQKGLPAIKGIYDSSTDTLKFTQPALEVKIVNGTIFMGSMKYCNDWLTTSGTEGMSMENKKKLQSRCININTFKKISN